MKKSTKREIQTGILNIICEVAILIGFITGSNVIKICTLTFYDYSILFVRSVHCNVSSQ